MTGDDVIEDTVRELLGGTREELNQLDANTLQNAESLAFKYPLGAIREGAQLCIGNEMFRVWTSDEGTKTAVVQPGMLGSTSATHTADDLVYVNPRFPRFAVFKALNDEIRSLSAPTNGLYYMDTYEFEASGSVVDYGLPADVIDVYDVYIEDLGPTDEWPRLPNWDWNPNANETTFIHGKSVHVPGVVLGRTVRVVYKADFVALTSSSQDLSTVGHISESMQDILHWGILLRMGPSREIKRNFTENQRGDQSRLEQVQAGSVTNSFSWINKMKEKRVIEERTRLERLYPPRKPAR
jgi:hypothetical protein